MFNIIFYRRIPLILHLYLGFLNETDNCHFALNSILCLFASFSFIANLYLLAFVEDDLLIYPFFLTLCNTESPGGIIGQKR